MALYIAAKHAVNGLPGLMQLPVLGSLFRSRDYVNNQTELMVLVTRRRAMLASNPLRNSQPELIADDGAGRVSSGASYSLAQTRPDSGTLAQVYKKE